MDQEARELFQAQAFIYKHMFNYMDSMSLKCAVELGIPDAIQNHQKPIPLSDLASSLQISPSKLPHLHQLMRLLVHAGFFATVGEEEDDLAYALTPPSKLLLKDHPASLSPTVLPLLQPALLRPWERLGDWFGGGESETTAFAAAHGMSFWEYGDRNPDFLRHFLETAMASDSRILCAAIPEYRAIFEGVSSLVDVGGGTGSVARAISEAFPDVKCTVLDLPQVVVDLPKTRNLDFVGGDMFRSVPSADAVLLKVYVMSDCACLHVGTGLVEA